MFLSLICFKLDDLQFVCGNPYFVVRRTPTLYRYHTDLTMLMAVGRAQNPTQPRPLEKQSILHSLQPSRPQYASPSASEPINLQMCLALKRHNRHALWAAHL